MSDNNRIIIDAANFDRSMPKWATEDTLSRLEKLIKTASKDDQRLLKETHKTFKNIEKLDREILKSSNLSNAKLLKELTKITKILGQTAASNKSNDSAAKSKEDTKKLLQSQDKTSKDTIKTIDAGTKQASKDANKIAAAIKKSDDNDDNRTKQVVDSNKDVEKQVKQATSELASLLKASNEIQEKSENILSEISKHLHKSNQTTQPTTSPSENDRDDTGFKNSVDSGFSKVNANLDMIQRTLEVQNNTTRSLVNNTTSKEDFASIVDRQTREYTRVRETATERSGNTMRDMFENARNASSGGEHAGLGMLSKTLGSMSSTLGGLVRILRATPLGALASGAALAASMVNKTAEYAYDAQRDFRDMMDRGFTFNVLGGESVENGESRLDGITLRRTITDNSVGLETATKVLEHNTRLINDLGISNVFGEIGRVLGGTNDPNSFVNQIGLTRDHVAMMVGDFYSIKNRVSNINSEYTALERENLAKQFVQNVRGMSATLGVSMEEIRQHIAEFTKTDEFLATDSFFSGSEIMKGFLGSSGLNQELQDAIFYSIISPMGAVDERVQNAIGDDVGSMYLFEALQKMKDSFNEQEFASTDDQQSYIADMVRGFISNVEATTGSFTRDGSSSELAHLTANNQRGFTLIANLLQNELQTSLDAPRLEPEDRFAQTSEINQQALFLENFKQGLEADTENLFAKMADSASGREAIKGIMDVDQLLKESQLAIINGLSRIADLLDGGPIPKILSMVRTGLRHITELIQSLPFFGKSPKFDDPIAGRDASQLYSQLKGGILSEEQYNKLFQETENDDGDIIIDLHQDIDPDIFKDVMTQALSGAETFEERENLSALLRSLERGFDDGNVSTSDELSRALGNMSEDLRYSATSGLGAVDREKLEDLYDGRIDSFAALIETPMRDFNAARRESLIASSRGNHGVTGLSTSNLSGAAPEMPQYADGHKIETDLASMIEAQTNKRSEDLAAARRQNQDIISSMANNGETPDVDTPDPIVNVATPEIDTPEAIVNVTTPEIDTPEPVVNVASPEIDVPEPIVNVSTPEVDVPEPVVNVSTPDVTVPEIDVPEPIVNVTTPEIDTHEPIVNVASPELDIPDINVPEPVVNVSTPEVAIPEIDVPEPVVNVATPEIDTHEPIINVATPEVDVPDIDIPDQIVNVNAPEIDIPTSILGNQTMPVDPNAVDVDSEVARLSETIESLNQMINQQHSHYLSQQQSNENAMRELREQVISSTVNHTPTSLEALKGFDRVTDTEDLLDTSATPEELLSITNRLLAENNDINRLNVTTGVDQRDSIKSSIDDIDMDIRIGDLSIQADDLININPIIRELSNTKRLLSDNLNDIYRLLGGDIFSEFEGNVNSFNAHGNVQASTSEDVDLFFERLVKQESGNRQFDSDGNPLTSYAGAIGAAQIMPATARDIAQRNDIEFDDHKFRYDEEYNKMLGRLHIGELLERYDGDTVLASMAYNAGIGGSKQGQGGVERMMALYGDPRKGDITHEDFLNTIEENHSHDISSWGVQTVPYARNVSFIGLDRDVNADLTPNTNLTPDANGVTENPMAAVSARINQRQREPIEQSGLLGVMSNQLTEQRSAATTLVEILDHLRGEIVDPDPLLTNIDTGQSSRLNTAPNVTLPEDEAKYIDRTEVEGLIASAIREYESNRAEKEAPTSIPTPPPEYASTIPEEESENGDLVGVLNSINESSNRVEEAIIRNTRAIEEYMSKII